MRYTVSKYEKCNGDVTRVDYDIEADNEEAALAIARERYCGGMPSLGTLQIEHYPTAILLP